MYSVSDAYLEAMKAPVQRFALEGRVGGTTFSEENILAGTFQITNQNTDDSQIMVGSTYVGQLSATFMGLDIPRYAWKGKVITANLVRFVGSSEGNREPVPLGIYVISDAVRTAEGISVTAYDYMTKFDKDVNFDTTSGRPYAYLAYMCTRCQVTLGMTQADVEALPNGRKILPFPTDSGIGTYRDALSYIAAACGGYATINRLGELEIRNFGNSRVDTIDPEHRWVGGSFEDYRTKITGVQLTYNKDESVIYKHRTPDDGLTLDLGANPFLQFRNKSTAEEAVMAILYALEAVEYVPFNVQMIGDPAYDLGDCFQLVDGLADLSGLFCLNKFTWTYNGSYDAVGVGQDPAANAESKTDKALAALGANSKGNKIEIYRYINLQRYNIHSDDVTIIDMEFTAFKDTTAFFMAEILLDVNTSSTALGTVKYIMNELEITDYHPKETWIDGKHILHLLYHIDATALELTHWVVKLNLSGGSAVIGIGQIKASIHGQGLMRANSWDGRIYAEDVISEATLAVEPELVAFGDNPELTISEVIEINAEDSIGLADIGTEPDAVAAYDDTVYLNKKAVSALTWQEVYELQGGWEELFEDYIW